MLHSQNSVDVILLLLITAVETSDGQKTRYNGFRLQQEET